MESQKPKGAWIIVALVVGVLFLGVGYVFQSTLSQQSKHYKKNDSYLKNEDLDQNGFLNPVIPDEAWNIYASSTYGFSMKVPKKMFHYFGSECEWKGDSYRPEGGVVPVKVFEGDNVVYVSSEYFYELFGETEKDGIHYYSGCEKVTNSLDKLKDEKYFQQQSWEFVVKNISNDNELDDFLKERYGRGCSLGDKNPSDQEGVFDVSIEGDGKSPEETKCPVNYVTRIKYYPAKNKLVSWHLGQAPTFPVDGGYEGFYDGGMVHSFKFE